MNKMLVIGDLHLRESLGYSDYIENGRTQEENEILDFIVNESTDCNSIIFLGDQLNSKTNSAGVIKKFVRFIERFSGKDLYIILGNHEIVNSNGNTAIDFLKEVKNSRWHIITEVESYNIGNTVAVFCPYLTKSGLEVETNEEAKEKIHSKLACSKFDFLFIHHAISDTKVTSGILVDTFPEPILDKKRLLKHYDLIVGGHIHAPSLEKNVLVAGSIFNNEVGETQKYVWKIDADAKKVDRIPLPGRGVYKLEDPTDEQLSSVPKSSIIKVILTKKKSTAEIIELKEKLSTFDTYILLEQTNKKRAKMHYGEGESILEFNVEGLLEVYAKERKLDYSKLLKGFELIK